MRAALASSLLALTACSATAEGNGASGEAATPSEEVAAAPDPAEPARPVVWQSGAVETTAIQRLETIAAEVSAWREAANLAAAKRHAEAVRNLIVGPAGPGYGDSDQDGVVAGASPIGLLPGRAGTAALAIPAANDCVTRDLLGGSWENPEKRWSILQGKIEAWSQSNNTFPTLPSHAQRVVGWATLALNAADLATARDYASHASIHVRVSRKALTNC